MMPCVIYSNRIMTGTNMTGRKNTPYGDNILIQGLGPILNRNTILSRLTELPPAPPKTLPRSKLERLHALVSLIDLHIPSLEGARIYETIDLMLRQSYRYRNPGDPKTWQMINGEPGFNIHHRAPAMSAIVASNSGMGKTQSIFRVLETYPEQVILHKKFPNIVGSHPQVVWLSVDAPSSGKSSDLAENLMRAWDNTLEQYIPNYISSFTSALSKDHRDGLKMLNQWHQVALAGYFGVLHLDEIQNLFKLATLRQRRVRNKQESPPELSIVEDKCLKWILSLLNTGQIPVIFSGTLDGVGALTKRISTTERITTGGFHKLLPFTQTNPKTWEMFFAQLISYQYVKKPLPDSENFRQLILNLTAGVPRIILALWISAHRVAFERSEDSLRLEDFEKAANTYLAPLKPAIAALNSGDPVKMAKFDDLLPRDDGVWESFWNPLS